MVAMKLDDVAFVDAGVLCVCDRIILEELASDLAAIAGDGAAESVTAPDVAFDIPVA